MPNHVQVANCYAYYWLEETSGTVADNAEGTAARDGTVNSASAWSASGYVDRGTYTANSYNLKTPFGIDTLKAGNFTINFWYNVATYASVQEDYLWGDWKVGGGYYGAYIKMYVVNQATRTWSFELNACEKINWVGPTTGTWTQLTIQFTQSTGKWEIFQDGESQGSDTTALGGDSGNNAMDFGASGYGAGDIAQFYGYIDEVQITTALTAPSAFSAQNLTQEVTDSFSLTDLKLLQPGKTLNDSFSMVDVKSLQAGKTVKDSYTLTDILSKLGAFNKTATDVFSLVDSRTNSIGRNFSDSFTIQSSLLKSTTKDFNDSYSLVSSVNKSTAKSFSDSFSLAENLDPLLVYVRILTDSFTLSDSKSFQIEKTLSDYVLVGSDVLRPAEFYRELADSIVLTDSLIKTQFKEFSDNFSLNDSFFKDSGKDLRDTYTLVSNLSKSSEKSISDSFSLVDSLNKQAGRTLADSFSLIDSLEKNIGYDREFSDAFSLADFVDRLQFKELIDSFSLAEAINFDTRKSLTDSFNAIISISKGQYKTLFDSINVHENVFSELKEFLNAMQADFATILSDVPFSTEVTWARYAQTEDTMGHNSSDRTTTFTQVIDLIIQPISELDRKHMIMGEGNTGDLKGYCANQYRTTTGMKEIEVDDEITYSGRVYNVESVKGKWHGDGVEIYRKLILKAIDND